MKKFLSMSLAALLVVSIAGCSSTEEPASSLPSASSASNEAAFGYNTEIEANLTTWTWDTGGVDLEMSVIQKKYPGINMEYTVVAGEDYLKKIQTTVASGSELPDIVNADGFWRGKLYNMGILERLDAEPYNFDRSTVFDYAVPYMVTEQD